MNNSGVYLIKNTFNGMYYVGSSNNLRVRKSAHLAKLNSSKHDNGYLQRAWDKYGKSSFEFSVLLFCAAKDLLFYEQKVIDSYNAANRDIGYNLCPLAGRTTGKIVSEQSKEKMRAARAGMKLSDEHKKKISESLIGNKRRVGVRHSDERKAAISAMFKGRVHSPETIAKMNESRKRTRELKMISTVT
jgi:group I intron endonuclease